MIVLDESFKVRCKVTSVKHLIGEKVGCISEMGYASSLGPKRRRTRERASGVGLEDDVFARRAGYNGMG